MGEQAFCVVEPGRLEALGGVLSGPLQGLVGIRSTLAQLARLPRDDAPLEQARPRCTLLLG